MNGVSGLGYLRFLPCLAAAFELDIEMHCYSWSGKESAVEHIMSRNFYAHHLIQQRKIHLTQRSRRAFAETTKTGKDVIIVIFLKPARRAQASWMNPPGTEASYPPQSLWPGELEPWLADWLAHWHLPCLPNPWPPALQALAGRRGLAPGRASAWEYILNISKPYPNHIHIYPKQISIGIQ